MTVEQDPNKEKDAQNQGGEPNDAPGSDASNEANANEENPEVGTDSDDESKGDASDDPGVGEQEDEDEGGAENKPDSDSGDDADDSSDTTAAAETEPAKPEPRKNLYKQIAATAKARVEAETGETFDEFNPEHQAALSVEIADVTRNVNAARSAEVQMNAIIAKAGGKEFQKFLIGFEGDAPSREIKRITEAQRHGDFGPSLEFIQKAADKYAELVAARKKAQDIKRAAKDNSERPEPPRSLTASGGRKPQKEEIPLRSLLGG